MKNNFESSLKGDSDVEVKKLFSQAKKRKDDRMRFRLLAELLEGKTVDITRSKQLFQALNREKLSFEELLKMNPEEAKECAEKVKEDRMLVAGGKWWDDQSKARWGKKGSIPPCCFYARPKEYWSNESLTNHFFNTFKAFRVSEKPI